jgi:plastocyanin
MNHSRVRSSFPLRISQRQSLRLGSLAVILLIAGGCSDPVGQSSEPATTASAAVVADSGVQTVTGRAPAATGGYPSIVILEPIGAENLPPQAAPPAMDQQQQTFIPSILLVRTGAPVDFLNHDDVLHNVRVKDDETKESAFNVAIPTGEKYVHTFARDGFYDVGCDIHPGMSAQIVSSSSPWTALADESGAFAIANVPNGPYKALAYAGARKIARDLNVAAGSATVDLTQP